MRRRPARPGRACLLGLVLLACGIAGRPTLAGESGMERDYTVQINGRSPDTARFELLLDPATGAERLAATAAELRRLGLRVPRRARGAVPLDSLSGLKYAFAERDAVAITASESALAPQVVSARPRPAPSSTDGALGLGINYTLTGNFGASDDFDPLRNAGWGASVEGFAFRSGGTVTLSGFMTGGPDSATSLVRQESRFTREMPGRMLSFQAGDVISSSLPWGRSVRMGGLRLRRDFGLRPDMVTEPLLSYSGAAAVPSTVDVFIDNQRTFSAALAPGPFRLEDVPVEAGNGEARVVIRDETGQSKEQTVTFFPAEDLLKPGLTDFSVELGQAREAYGIDSNRYGEDTMFSASLRYGLPGRRTLQAHLEGKQDLLMAAAGATLTPFERAELTLVGGSSRYASETDHFLTATLRTQIAGAKLQVSMLRSTPGFTDLAYATGRDYLGAQEIEDDGSLLQFPRIQDVLSLGLPTASKDGNLGLSLVHTSRESSEDFFASLTYSHRLDWRDAALNLQATHDIGASGGLLQAGLTLPIGGRTRVGTGMGLRLGDGIDGTGEGDEMTMNAYVARPITDRVGDWGYEARIEDGRSEDFARLRGSRRGRWGKTVAEANVLGDGATVDLRYEGALVAAGGHVLPGNQVTDAFAVVDVGLPDVPVYLGKREIARSGPDGLAVIPGLSGYKANRISVRPEDLPDDAYTRITAQDVVPRRRAGALVSLGGGEGAAALVVLRDRAGAPLPMGSLVYLNGAAEPMVLGYDGEIWLDHLRAQNRVTVEGFEGSCAASFGYSASDTLQTVIDPVTCG